MGSTSRHRPWPQVVDHRQNAAEQVTRQRHLGHLENRVAGVRDHLRADLHHLLAKRGQRPSLDLIWQNQSAEEVGQVVGRPPHEVRRSYASFRYQAQSWSCSRRVVAKVEWHPGELYPRVGFLVTNLCRPPERVVAFYNQRGTAVQWIREGKNAVNWTRLTHRTLEQMSNPALENSIG